MTKRLVIEPEHVRNADEITLGTIPVNQYSKTVKEEKKSFSKEDLIRIYEDMVYIREFENMLSLIKTKSEYRGVEYTYPGPAHLSIGQEASAVGMAFELGPDDFIFGSHRSHGEIIAKGLSAIRTLDEKALSEIMESYEEGVCLRTVQNENSGDTDDIAVDFFLYGILAEIFGREAGFTKGMGGSMHAFFTPFGIYPNNAIVGGSADIAAGAALFKKVQQKKGIVVANIGDGSLGCGPVWEAICFASMGQYRTLWDDPYRGGLPLIFNFMNNQYGMGGQTSGETMGFDVLARTGAGVNTDMLHAERVDGYNPLAVVDAMKRKRAVIEEKKGPVLLDTLTYRVTGHSPSDASAYRTKEEIEDWEQADSITAYGKELEQAGVCSKEDLESVWERVQERMTRVCRLAADEKISPRVNPETIEGMMFSNGQAEAMGEGEPEVLMPKDENPRVRQIAKKERFGLKEDGTPVPKIKAYQLRDGLFEAILDAFYRDPTLVAYGEENRDWGGAFAVYRGLTEALPYHRLFNSPISEGAIVGSAVGYGMCGGRVIAELMYCDFLGRAGDEVFNQLSKWQAMSGGVLSMPVVIRVSIGSKYGAQHSQDWTSLAAHVPGLKIAFPVTPYDAKGLLNSALTGTDPVIVFESQRIYDIGEQFRKEGVPEGFYTVPIGEPDVKMKGEDVTLLTVGATLYKAVEAASILKETYGISAELIDARSLIPFNYDPVIESVKKTGRIVLASDACERGSHLKDMAQTISELAFDVLDAPPVVVGARNWITPPHEMEEAFFPQAGWIVDAIHEKILPLKGHTSVSNFTSGEQKRRNRQGV